MALAATAMLVTAGGLAGAAPARAANPSPPTVATSDVEAIGDGGATFTGAVSSNGAPTTVRFEYGTTAGYGLTTQAVEVPADASNLVVRRPVVNLTAGTGYHVRLVATNAAGTVHGEDRAFSTTGTLRPPATQTRSVVDLNSGGATLVARVEPRSQTTTVFWEWGPSASYGKRTATQTIPAGSDPVYVRQPITGLSANTEYSYRAVAANASGTTPGRRHTFRTTRGVTGVSMKLATRHVGWSEQAFIGGKVDGLSVGQVRVTLWRQDHPFTAPFRPVKTAVASSSGTYGFTTRPLFWATRFRVTADTPAGIGSPAATTIGDLLTKLRVQARHRRTAQLRGYAYPATTGSATIQRRTTNGRWVTVKKGVALKVDQARNRSSFSAWVPRLSTRTARYRAVVTPTDAGAHAVTATRSSYVTRRR